MATQARAQGGSWGWLLGLLLALVVVAPALAAPAIPAIPETRVSDHVGVLADGVEQSLERRLAAYEAQTGHQLIVWIDRSTGELPIETFAVEAFERWKLGQAKLDDGLAIFIMVEDRTVRIEVGYGLEPTVTDLVASQVIRQTMVPAIEEGRWEAAVVGGVEALVDTIEGQAGALPPDPQASEAGQPAAPEERWKQILKIVGIVLGALLLLILFIINPRLAFMLLFFLGRGGGGGGGGFGGGGGRSGGGGATGRW